MLKDFLKRDSISKAKRIGMLSLLFVISPFSAIHRFGKKEAKGEMTGGVRASREPSGNTVIKSRDITYFKYEFNNNSIFYRGSNVPYQYCIFSMTLEEDKAQVNLYLDDYSPNRFEFTVNKEKMMLLQEVVEDLNLASSHGRYREVAGLPAGVGSRLRVEYASGERISAYDNSGHVISNLSTSILYDFFRELAMEAGQEDFAAKHKRPTSDEEYEVLARGTWQTKDGNYTLEFNGNELRISEGEEMKYEGLFSIKLGMFFTEQERMDFGPFSNIFIKSDKIIINIRGGNDLEFSPGLDFYPKMVQGNWLDTKQEYRLKFEGTNLKIFEGEKLLLDDEISFRYSSIQLKGREEEPLGPFGNLYAEFGNIQVLPYQGESEDLRRKFYPTQES